LFSAADSFFTEEVLELLLLWPPPPTCAKAGED
jgi:hypothetical protein